MVGVLVCVGLFGSAPAIAESKRGTERAESPVARQLQDIQRVARFRYLQRLIAIMKKYPREATGVHRLVRDLEGINMRGWIDVEAVTDRNQAYWDASNMMPRGTELPLLVKSVLHAANGSMDLCARHLLLAKMTSTPSSPGSQVLADLEIRIRAFSGEVSKRVLSGIDLHNHKRYDEAIAVYEGVLDDFPRSAWATYQRWFARMQNNEVVVDRDWPDVARQVYAFDPMFDMQTHSANDKEAFQIFRRLDTRGLFSDPQRFERDLVNFAQIALDLDAYGLGAEGFWKLVKYVPQKGVNGEGAGGTGGFGAEQSFDHYVYCLHKLGVRQQQLLTSVQFGSDKAFAQVQRLQHQRMKHYLGRNPKD